MVKQIVGVGLYFIGALFVVFFFVGVRTIEAIQMASLITVVHMLMLFIDRHDKG
ncbi:hypothetical protein [Paenibacillus turpanensis]|uniref:hypothetical protein n=1 Tax=Paenibacillus turpanensis TaxID=2689078 RepID=UPI00140DB615|nr:hypothetical protein [Paenibacillus turpanensis]